jgi:hypothetical protein
MPFRIDGSGLPRPGVVDDETRYAGRERFVHNEIRPLGGERDSPPRPAVVFDQLIG